MKLLAFDTSSIALAVALLEDERLVAETTVNSKKNHSISLMPTIDFLMAQVGWEPSDLDRIVVAQGPGSYTGLRVAVATAKTLAYSLNVDLVGVSSLFALLPLAVHTGLMIPLIDARRNSVYAGFYEDGQAIRPDSYLTLEEVLTYAQSANAVTFTGEVQNFKDQILQALPQANIQPSLPSAYALGKRGLQAESVSVHAFVPQYLKRVEAEENWLQTHGEEDSSHYIKRV
ncbi:tRNA (adenosine(37)-N6)-threonylcarbamoyltransferase complex dimerization subunit type 1 TsaB [Streptococcus dentapri]|uniref:tRNA (Adenosine(37)-N6)-threonylcarbamoyltransferase complex dimerization subunit type 1 TsaB n=1 Tax=Streptococcus dentapri TaxID=573564 RepID=A0ABV8CYY1_9STRE